MKNSSFIEEYLFSYFYKISEIIVIKRNFDLIFSTDLLKKLSKKKTIKNHLLILLLKNLSIKKKIKIKILIF